MIAIRPELRAQAWRWREALVGLAVLLPGAWAVLASGGLVRAGGLVLAALGCGLIVAGVQRGRFRLADDGTGVVEVTEAQVSYLAPFGGGVVAVGALARVELIPGWPVPAWLLTEAGLPGVIIPTNARNAEALFDVFASLPGLRTEAMLAALADPPAQPVLIWAGRPAAASGLRAVPHPPGPRPRVH